MKVSTTIGQRLYSTFCPGNGLGSSLFDNANGLSGRAHEKVGATSDVLVACKRTLDWASARCSN